MAQRESLFDSRLLCGADSDGAMSDIRVSSFSPVSIIPLSGLSFWLIILSMLAFNDSSLRLLSSSSSFPRIKSVSTSASLFQSNIYLSMSLSSLLSNFTFRISCCSRFFPDVFILSKYLLRSLGLYSSGSFDIKKLRCSNIYFEKFRFFSSSSNSLSINSLTKQKKKMKCLKRIIKML